MQKNDQITTQLTATVKKGGTKQNNPHIQNTNKKTHIYKTDTFFYNMAATGTKISKEIISGVVFKNWLQ